MSDIDREDQRAVGAHSGAPLPCGRSNRVPKRLVGKNLIEIAIALPNPRQI